MMTLLFLLALACTPDPGDEPEIDKGAGIAELAASPLPDLQTVIAVTWNQTRAGNVWITFEVEGESRTTPTWTTEAGPNEGLLLGIPPLTDVSWELHFDDGTEVFVSDPGLTSSGDVPSSLAQMNLTIDDPSNTVRYVLGISQGETSHLYILDNKARYVWYKEMPAEEFNLEAIPHWDGQGLMYNRMSKDVDPDSDIGAVVDVGLDGTERQQWATSLAHHVFSRLPNNTLGWLAIDHREHPESYEGYPETKNGEYMYIVGDKISELDITTGQTRDVWSIWDWLAPEPNNGWGQPFYPFGYDWSHANALSYNDANDSYLISFANLDTVAEVSRSSGEVIRCFGAVEGCYGFEREAEAFKFQHGSHIDENGLFHTTSKNYGGNRTVAYTYEIDDTNQLLKVLWSYDQGEYYARILGEPHLMSDGNTLLNYGSAGVMQQVTPEGVAVWEVKMGLGWYFAETLPIDNLYELTVTGTY